jgi:hypothetical protein
MYDAQEDYKVAFQECQRTVLLLQQIISGKDVAIRDAEVKAESFKLEFMKVLDERDFLD